MYVYVRIGNMCLRNFTLRSYNNITNVLVLNIVVVSPISLALASLCSRNPDNAPLLLDPFPRQGASTLLSAVRSHRLPAALRGEGRGGAPVPALCCTAATAVALHLQHYEYYLSVVSQPNETAVK